MYYSSVFHLTKTPFNLNYIIDNKTGLLYISADNHTYYISNLLNSLTQPLLSKNSLYLLSSQKNIWRSSTTSFLTTFYSLYARYLLRIEIVGVGSRFIKKDKSIYLFSGYSHVIKITLPLGVLIKVDNKIITLSYCNKYNLGNIYYLLKRVAKKDIYKGKGIKKVYELLTLKIGKSRISKIK